MKEKELIQLKYDEYVITFIAIVVGFIVTSIFIIVGTKIDLFTAWRQFLIGPLGTINGFAEVLVKSSPILLSALGVSFGLQGKFNNIGSDGQMYMGALATTGVGLLAFSYPSIAIVPLTFFLSFLVGALWAIAAGVIRIKFKVNEVISTILLNFVAYYIAQTLLFGPWKGKTEIAQYQVMSDYLARSAWLPKLIPATRAHIGVLAGFIAAAILFIIVWKTTWGFKLRCTGGNPKASTAAGINTNKIMLSALLIGGGLAGIAGWGEIAGLHHFMRYDFSPGYGFTGAMLAYLAKGNIILTLVVSVFFGILVVGAQSMQFNVNIPYVIVDLLQGIILICVLVGYGLSGRTK